jgi:hypothetical protein
MTSYHIYIFVSVTKLFPTSDECKWRGFHTEFKCHLIVSELTAEIRVWGVLFRLRNVSIVGVCYLLNCATCFGHTTIFKQNTYFPKTYNGSVLNGVSRMKICVHEDGRMTETRSR